MAFYMVNESVARTPCPSLIAEFCSCESSVCSGGAPAFVTSALDSSSGCHPTTYSAPRCVTGLPRGGSHPERHRPRDRVTHVESNAMDRQGLTTLIVH